MVDLADIDWEMTMIHLDFLGFALEIPGFEGKKPGQTTGTDNPSLELTLETICINWLMWSDGNVTAFCCNSLGKSVLGEWQ